MKTLIAVSRSSEGHRPEYNEVLRREAHAVGVEVEVVRKLRLRHLRHPIIFMMLDEDLPAFLLASAFSIFSRKKVTGLFFRPGECFRPGRKYRAKAVLFATLRKLGAEVIILLPFSIDPRLASVAARWVYDPQLWDSVALDRDSSNASDLSCDVRRHARGRLLVAAIGEQSREKGFHWFCEAWRENRGCWEGIVFAAAGRLDAESKRFAVEFEATGGYLVDRFLTEAELWSMYSEADMVWAAYPPDYDQASGIAGRAFQSGLPVIVRRGSFIATLLRTLGRPAIEIERGAEAEALQNVLADLRPLPPPVAEMTGMRARFRWLVRFAAQLPCGIEAPA